MAGVARQTTLGKRARSTSRRRHQQWLCSVATAITYDAQHISIIILFPADAQRRAA